MTAPIAISRRKAMPFFRRERLIDGAAAQKRRSSLP